MHHQSAHDAAVFCVLVKVGGASYLRSSYQIFIHRAEDTSDLLPRLGNGNKCAGVSLGYRRNQKICLQCAFFSFMTCLSNLIMTFNYSGKHLKLV